MKFTEALREMKEGKEGKASVMGRLLVLGQRKTDSNDSVQTTGL